MTTDLDQLPEGTMVRFIKDCRFFKIGDIGTIRKTFSFNSLVGTNKRGWVNTTNWLKDDMFIIINPSSSLDKEIRDLETMGVNSK